VQSISDHEIERDEWRRRREWIGVDVDVLRAGTDPNIEPPSPAPSCENAR
jgi:hypothetical protein